MHADYIDWGFWLGEIADAINLPEFGEDGGESYEWRAFDDLGWLYGPNAYAYVNGGGLLVVVGNDGNVTTFSDINGDPMTREDAVEAVIGILGTW